jgi:hypothetical protein
MSVSTSRSLVKEIQAVLASANEVHPIDYLTDLADRYADLATQVSRKVADCKDLLEQGRHQEARERSREGGDLLQDYQTLDFPEAASWEEWCHTMDLPRSPVLNATLIRFMIDQLYEASGQMEVLLRRHRRLALGRAPLVTRLSNLRRLAVADPKNANWRADLRDYEEARLLELRKLAAAGKRQATLTALKGIQQELVADSWVSPPASLLREVTAAIAPLNRVAADQRYGKLVDALHEAHGAMDEERCKALLDDWVAVRATTDCEPSHESVSEIEPIKTWLGELRAERLEDQEFEVACQELERALDDELDRATLERLAAAVLRMERGLPPLLSARCTSALEQRTRADRRRFALTFVLSAGLIAVVGVAIAYGWTYFGEQREQKRWLGQLEPLVESKDVVAAHTLFATLEEDAPRVFATPEIQQLHARFKGLTTEDTERRARLADCLRALEATELSSEEYPRLLKRASALALTFAEKASVQDWDQKLSTFKTSAKAKGHAAIEVEIAKLEQQFQELKAVPLSATDELHAKSQECRALGKAVREAGGADAGQRQRLEAILKAVVKLTQDALSAQEQTAAAGKLLETIQAQGFEPARLVGSLRAFAKRFPEHPQSADFVSAAAFGEEWVAAAAWGQIVRRWHWTVRVRTSEPIEGRRAQLEAFLAEHKGTLTEQVAQACGVYLDVAEEALTPEGVIDLDTLDEVLSSRLMADSFVIVHKGQRFYLPGSTVKEAGPGKVLVDYFFDAEGKKTRSVRLAETRAPERSPQSLLCKNARALRKAQDGRWETLYLRLAELTRQTPGLDPILAVRLLRFFMSAAQDTTPFAKLGPVSRPLNDLTEAKISDPWMDPLDAGANQARTRLRPLVEDLENLEPVIAKTEARLKELTGYLPAAVYLGSETKFAVGGHIDGASLYVLSDGFGDGLVARKIGSVTKGKTALEPGALAKVPVGTLIFWNPK